MAYEAKTQNDLAKWWVIGTGSTVNRLSEIMDDCPNGPAIYYTTGWTAAGLEYYRTQSTANDSAAEKIGAGAWTALVLGAGIGALNAGEYFYDAATTRIYVRLTGDVTPNATNQVRAHYLWDGSGAGPAIMTEVVEDSLYRIHLAFDVGDGSTATSLLSKSAEVVMFDSGVAFNIKASGTLTLGEKVGSYGCNGAIWVFKFTATTTIGAANAGYFYAYGSMICKVDSYAAIYINCGQGQEFLNTTFNWNHTGSSNKLYFSKDFTIASCFITSVGQWIPSGFSAGSIDNLHIHNSPSAGIGLDSAAEVTINGLKITSQTTTAIPLSGNGSKLTVLDPQYTVATPNITTNETNYLKEQYSIAIHVADRDGNDLSGATVTWLDSESNTGNDDTDVNGDVNFTLLAKQWVGTSETLTNFNTFTFTVELAGYKTLTLENITLDTIDWHLELQPLAYPEGGWSHNV